MMNCRKCLSIFTTSLLAAGMLALPAAAATNCGDLLKLSNPGMKVLTAKVVPAGAFKAPEGQEAFAGPTLPEFCRVEMALKPTADSDIRVEVWLPASRWNGKYQAVGEGGLAGFIPHRFMAPALAAGYATSCTDTGHVGNNADFMPAHPEKLVDFAYRSTHEMAAATKALIASYYGKAPARSYYNGCSGAGRHGLTSAQRYPGDFDGIVAGAFSWNQPRLDAVRIAVNLTVNRSPEGRIPAGKYRMIKEAVLEACDALDGVADGVIENPLKCDFDYATLACKGADGPSCLTAPQVASAKVLTSPFKDPATGAALHPAHLHPGVELEWTTLGGPKPLTNSMQRVQNFHLKDPKWQPRPETIVEDIERATRMDGGLVASNSFDLKPFFDRGGKLLLWHGWDDPQVPANNSIDYYQNVLKTLGSDADNSIALFLLPGVSHCGGGPGCDKFNKMGAIEDWVEYGKKPARLIASHMTPANVRDMQVDRTRPLCPFPQVAKYVGSGSTDDEANFVCREEK